MTELQRLINRKKYMRKKINRADRREFRYQACATPEKIQEWQEEVDSLEDSIRVLRGSGRDQRSLKRHR